MTAGFQRSFLSLYFRLCIFCVSCAICELAVGNYSYAHRSHNLHQKLPSPRLKKFPYAIVSESFSPPSTWKWRCFTD